MTSTLHKKIISSGKKGYFPDEIKKKRVFPGQNYENQNLMSEL